MANDEGIKPEEDLRNQIANLDELIRKEDETARLYATTHKDVATQAFKRKKILQGQRDQLIASITTLKKYTDLQQESENEDKEWQEVEEAIKSANETKAMTDPVLKNELKRHREIINSSKSGDQPKKDGDDILAILGLGLVGLGIGLGLVVLLQFLKGVK